MAQQLAPQLVGSASLQQLEQENAELRRYLAAQRSVIESLERRAGRSLDSMGVHLRQLSLPPELAQQPVQHQTHLDAVQNEVNSLCDLLADTMLLQKLEAGKVQVNLAPLDFAAILSATTRHLLAPKDGSPVRLVCEIADALPTPLADQDLLEAVLTDLLGRALKYSDCDSPVVLGVEAVGGRVQIRVTAQRFAPIGNRDFATEIVLCCRRIEVQMGEVSCQQHPDGLQTVMIALKIAAASEH
jgi:signal transduction histidine kinase